MRVAAYGVIIDGGRMLLAHWNDPVRGAWTLPGGGLEAGEDPADAAVREILEETGYEAELGELLGVDSFVVPAEDRLTPEGRPLHALRIVYRARVLGGQLRNEEDGSTDEARWFELTEIPALNTVALVDAALRMHASRAL